jgi:hypothetical protein
MEYDDATLDMMAMEYRTQVAERIDELLEVFGRSRMIFNHNGQAFVSTEILYGIAAVLAERGIEAEHADEMWQAAAYADGATLINILALRADGEEANVNTEQFFS